ncbi:hypothetical protein MY04_3589 [Flammeovirga sp. MY04]|uniref:hypothetical protein n=1 Tax=Flammeovirga sp. MY04 TaxID=1191459 RepID=UPI00080641D0|nr:hypothetical protein [Flammeovirga sp. MY04]ANQ50937.1 hypothetical protein MY04_3589 [Flammeovirga sp. MY04]
MKLKKFALIISVLAVSAMSCDSLKDNDSSSLNTTLDETSSDLISSALEAQDYTDNISEDMMESSTASSSSSFRTTSDSEGDVQRRPFRPGARRFFARHHADCADITITNENDTRTVVMDFSNGLCENREGETISGVVTSTHTFGESSMAHSTTFQDFSRNDNTVNGTSSITGENVVFEEVVEEGKKPKIASATLTKTTNVTIDHPATEDVAAYTETIVRSLQEEVDNGTKTVTGTLTVTSTGENSGFTSEITSALVFSPRCSGERPVFVALQGTEVITRGDDTITVDYGSGECDYIITITTADGTEKVVDLSEGYDYYGFIGVRGGLKVRREN